MTPNEAALIQIEELLDVATRKAQYGIEGTGTADYILVNTELLKLIIGQVTDLTEALDRLETWARSLEGDGR